MRRSLPSSRMFIAVVLFTSTIFAQISRPPAAPLVTHDPYFSIWSAGDRLTDGATRHWTGKPQRLSGLIRIDGHMFRWMGDAPRHAPVLSQSAMHVTATRTSYRFESAGVGLTVDFLSPLLPSDLDVMSRPVSYITMTANSLDASPHSVQLLFAADASLAIDRETQDVTWSRSRLRGMSVLRASDFDQPILQKSGDDLRIDWGTLLLAVPDQDGSSLSTQPEDAVVEEFGNGTRLTYDDLDSPRRADRRTLLAASFDLGEVSSTPASRHLILAYDDIYSIEYMNRWLRPYWRRKGMTTGELLDAAERDYLNLDQKSRQFDDELSRDLRQTGGEAYEELAVLAFRQAIAAHKLAVDVDGRAMLFPKENFSNGCISTVDVIYPSSPLFLFFNPELLKALLEPLKSHV